MISKLQGVAALTGRSHQVVISQFLGDMAENGSGVVVAIGWKQVVLENAESGYPVTGFSNRVQPGWKLGIAGQMRTRKHVSAGFWVQPGSLKPSLVRPLRLDGPGLPFIRFTLSQDICLK